MAKYEWDWGNAAPIPLVPNGNPVLGQTNFGQNTQTNGLRMQPDSYYSSMFLEMKRLKATDLIYASFAEKKTIKKGLDRISLRGYQPLKAHIVPLVEGLPPTGDRAHGKAIVARTRQYGRFMEFTDQFEYKVMDPIMEIYTKELADVANETIDMLAQAALLAECQIFFPAKSGATSKVELVEKVAEDAAKPTPLHIGRPTFEDLRIIKLTMEAAHIRPRGGTFPVFVSPAVFFDLQTDATLENKFMNFGQTNSPMTNDEIPVMYGIKVHKAMNAHVETVTSTGVGTPSGVIHHSLMIGDKVFSEITIEGSGGVDWFRKGLGSSGTIDPLNQRQTFGWKMSNIGFKVTDVDGVVDYMTIPSQSEISFNDFEYVTTKSNEIGITDAMAKQLSQSDWKLSTAGAPVNTIPSTVVTAVALTQDHLNAITGLEKDVVGQFTDIKADGETAQNTAGQGADNFGKSNTFVKTKIKD